MKFLLYLTIALCVISRAYAPGPLYTCSVANIASTNCGSIINGLLAGTSGYSHFDLNQLSSFGFNVSLMDAGLTTTFAAITANPICSQCQANLKAFYCLNLYPACVAAKSGAIGSKPSFPCNDANCTSLANSCTPGVFNPSSPIFNSAISTNFGSSLGLAFSGIAAGFIAGTPLLFGLTSNATIECANQNTINTTLTGIIGEALLCTTAAVAAAYDTSNAAESCPCMAFPSSGTSYCTKAADAFTSIPSIYSAIGVGTVDAGISAYVQPQIGLFSQFGLNCTNCLNALNIYACSNGFLQCSASTSAVTAFQFPCKPVGSNFVSACSLNEVYGFANSSYNLTPDPVTNAALLAAINSANALPTTGCASQAITADGNCGCVSLASTDICYPYITGAATFLPLPLLNIVATSVTASLSNLTALFYTCPNCVSRLQSAVCNAIYPACNVYSTAGPRCTSSCQTELSSCGSLQELCTAFQAGNLLSSAVTCFPYTSTVLSLNTTNCPAIPAVVLPCGTSANILAADSTCLNYVSTNSIVPLASLDPINAALLAGIDAIIANNVSGQVCSNCQAAVNELLCNMAYLHCQPYYPTSTGLPITLYLPQWGCTSDLNLEFADCVPPTYSTPTAMNAFIAGFSNGFAINNVTIASSFNTAASTFSAMFSPLAAYNINYACFDFHTSIGRSFAQTCPCMTLDTPTLGGCAPYVNYQVSVMLNSNLIAPAVLSDPSLSSLLQFSCPACQAKATEFACLAAFPQCSAPPSAGYNFVDVSICQNSLITCRAAQYADSELLSLVGLAKIAGLPIAVPNVTTILSACNNFQTGGYVPVNYTQLPQCPCASLPTTSLCANSITHSVGPFLAALPDTLRATLESTILGYDASVDYTGCTNCKNAVDFNLCNVVYPICTTTQLVVRACLSNCTSNVDFCTDPNAEVVCATLAGLGALSNLTTCNPFTYSDTNCFTSSTTIKSSHTNPSGTSSLMPSFFVFILVALFSKILF